MCTSIIVIAATEHIVCACPSAEREVCNGKCGDRLRKLNALRASLQSYRDGVIALRLREATLEETYGHHLPAPMGRGAKAMASTRGECIRL